MRKLFSLALAAALFFSVTSLAAAQTVLDSTGLNTTVGESGITEPNSDNANIAVFIGFYIIQPVLGVVGLVFFCMMLYAGVLWMTAGGNTDNVKKAKQILGNGVVGVVIIVASYALTSAIFNAITSGNISG